MRDAAVFLIVTMVLVLKGLIMKLSGKDTADYWKKNFSRMSVLHRLFNSLFPLSWLLGRGGKSSGGSSGNDDDRDDDYDSYDERKLRRRRKLRRWRCRQGFLVVSAGIAGSLV